ncbi:unnamed protein product [Musa acuminata subsp. malaccensis]|uniref:(wild Malaysian banana) hypothetical protein n=1 Tax=Musa acuminata subsp. malaccensis TaxID=214687 RepID=A0A804K4M2_MUSAM|nr:PREDICTED: uncharacterized protein LOC103993422 isoform X1 [Musa acuminata subsp. malaccensis]CAG1831034.1 unnamed protein product [Musa acuminata subsp. malaccensis]
MADLDEGVLRSSIFDSRKGETAKSRGQLIERKIDIIESLAGKVSNRRSRRWLNDCLLIELVPRLNVEEIRGLFAPPPWGDNKPLSAFCMTNVKEWDVFRNVDMDVEASITKALRATSAERKVYMNTDKAVALNAWRRVDRRTREAMRRNFLPQLIEGYEERIRVFINDGVEDVLVLHVQDSFHRLLLHGVCEGTVIMQLQLAYQRYLRQLPISSLKSFNFSFLIQFYNLISITESIVRDAKLWKMTRIKKKMGCNEIPPNITLAQFLRLSKDGAL